LSASGTLARRISDLGEESLAEIRHVVLPANVPPWTATGMTLRRGEHVTILAEGRVVLAEALDLWIGPRLSVWARLDGRIRNGPCTHWSFEADADGPLELGIYQGEWASAAGDLATPLEGYASLSGTIDVVLLRWRGDAARGLRRVLTALPDAAPVAQELARLAAPIPPPARWHYHRLIGESEIYESREGEGGARIVADARSDAGILQHPLSFPLGDETVLAWRWKVDELPSARPEDGLPTHDYVSIAAEFENGRDLTWMWSAGLAKDTCFHCPLPGWNTRETHVVVRSGAERLGEWHDESRPIRADYVRAVGAPPARVVAIWLIAVSVFQHGRARAEFSDIWLRDGRTALRVL
jgi:hypothetical protein